MEKLNHIYSHTEEDKKPMGYLKGYSNGTGYGCGNASGAGGHPQFPKSGNGDGESLGAGDYLGACGGEWELRLVHPTSVCEPTQGVDTLALRGIHGWGRGTWKGSGLETGNGDG